MPRSASWAWLLSLVPVCSLAAERDRAAGIVHEVLAREATADVPDRAALLRGVLAQSPKLTSARWATGQFSVGEEWQTVAERIKTAAADPLLIEYCRLRDAGEFSPARHRELATWCGQRGLADQERAHLWALLNENANQPDLWKKLGYRQVDGNWLTADEARELERLWQQRERELKRWLPKAESFARRLADPHPLTQASAREQLRNLEDVAALPALETTLCAASPDLALEFVAWAEHLDRVEITLALARQAIVSPWENVRTAAIGALAARRLTDFTPALLNAMSTTVDHAEMRNNVRRRRAGDVIVVHLFQRELHDRIEVYRQTTLAQRVPAVVFRLPAGDPTGVGRRVNDVLVSTANTRLREDQERTLNDYAAAQERIAGEWNAAIREGNRRIGMVLAAHTDQSPDHTPQQWWTWWADHIGSDVLLAKASAADGPQKPIVEVNEVETVVDPTIRTSCLPAGTSVQTEIGLKPIETIRIGDRVLAKDIDTGELAFRPVLQTTVRSPQLLVKLGLASESIQATRGHHFWVSGQGWRMARELQPGDRLHGLTGTTTVSDVATGDVAAVYNLVVDRANTYFVGDSHILSHDVTSPVPTNVKVPGLK